MEQIPINKVVWTNFIACSAEKRLHNRNSPKTFVDITPHEQQKQSKG